MISSPRSGENFKNKFDKIFISPPSARGVSLEVLEGGYRLKNLARDTIIYIKWGGSQNLKSESPLQVPQTAPPTPYTPQTDLEGQPEFFFRRGYPLWGV